MCVRCWHVVHRCVVSRCGVYGGVILLVRVLLCGGVLCVVVCCVAVVSWATRVGVVLCGGVLCCVRLRWEAAGNAQVERCSVWCDGVVWVRVEVVWCVSDVELFVVCLFCVL